MFNNIWPAVILAANLNPRETLRARYDINSIKIQKTSKKIEATNVETNEVTLYPSIGAAARALGYHQPSISLYLKENRTKPFKGLYYFRRA